GTAARSPGVRTFSASMGLARSPFIAKHEFGHAAFELGDEYTETNATRTVAPAQPPQTSQCCCVDDDGTGTTEGPVTGGMRRGVGAAGRGDGGAPVAAAKRCAGPEGPTGQRGAGGLGWPSGSGSNASFLAQNCGAKAEGGCPPLASQCVGQSAWLGATPPSVA